MLVLVVCQVVVAVFAFLYTEEFGQIAQTGFKTLWDDMINRNDATSREAINGIQRGLQCCGNTGPRNWDENSLPVPPSCCAEGVTNCNSGTAFQTGCGQLLTDLVTGSGMLIAWIAVVFAAFEVGI